MIQLFHQIINQVLGRAYYKMTLSEENKIIDTKIDQNKARFDLDRQTAKILALSSRNVSKYEFLTGKDVETIN